MRIAKLIIIAGTILIAVIHANCFATEPATAAPKTRVYTAAMDRQYHMRFCVKLKTSFNTAKTTLKSAIDQGLTPCERCSPPASYAGAQKKKAPPKKKRTVAQQPPKQQAKDSATILFTDNSQVAARAAQEQGYTDPHTVRFFANGISPNRRLNYASFDLCVKGEKKRLLNSGALDNATYNVKMLFAEYAAEEICIPLQKTPQARCLIFERNKYIGKSLRDREFYDVIEEADRHAGNICR